MVVSVGEQVAVDGSIRTRLVSGLTGVRAEVAEERWADDDVLLLELQTEIHPIATDAGVARNVAIVDMGHNGEHHVFLHLLRSSGGVHLAALGLTTGSTMLVVEGEDIALPVDVNKHRLVGVGDFEKVAKSFEGVVVSCP